MAVAFAGWHLEDVRPDLWSDVEKDLQVAVAQVWERLDDGRQVGEADLLRGLGAVRSEDLIDDVEELGYLLLCLFFSVWSLMP